MDEKYVFNYADFQRTVLRICDGCSRFIYSNGPTKLEAVNKIKKLWNIYRAKKRLKRLTFCRTLQFHIDEYLLKPGNLGYLEVKERNKGSYIDT